MDTVDTVPRIVSRLNPRYVCYAKAHGRSPDAMFEADDARYPGGRMAGFMIWIRGQWHEYRTAHGISPNAPVSNEQHDHFNTWLEAKMSDPLERIRQHP